MTTARSIATLVRLDSSFIVFLTIFIPLLSRTGSLRASLSTAIPTLFISMCTFIANDLDDLERDRVNHPERPLPSGQVRATIAAIIYFASLGMALFTIRAYTSGSAAFLYYTLLTLAISYNYIVENFAGLKSFYVAAVSSIPVLIVTRFYPQEDLHLVALAALFFVLGRELCMDFLDRRGDVKSFMHNIQPKILLSLALSSHGLGLLLLSILVDELLDVGPLALMASLMLLSFFYWSRVPRKVIHLMKLQLLIGLYFLV